MSIYRPIVTELQNTWNDAVRHAGKSGRDPLFIALIVGYVLWGCAFIYRTSFVINGVRYFVLFDDEMISMRYARNLAHGFGLVYNPGGDRVEGFTNPMWVLYMALLHLLPVAPEKMSLLVQLTGLALLALNLVVVARLGEAIAGGSRRVGLAAAFLSAFYLALNNWGLEGSEACALTVLMTAIALMTIRCVQKRTSPIPLYLLMGFATTFRMDMLLPALVVLAMLAVVDECRRFRHAVVGTLIVVLFVGAQIGFNQFYYGYPFPNTYYLKLTGFPVIPRVTRGAIATYRFLMEMNPLLPVLAIVVIWLRRDWRLLLLGLIIAIELAYNVWIGGDFTESPGGSNRFIAIVMPLLFVLIACGLDACASFFARSFSDFAPVAKLRAGGVLAILTVLTLLTVDMPVRNEAGGFGFNDYYGLPEASLILLNPPTGVGMNQLAVGAALQVEQMTDPQARIMVGGAGILPYLSDRYSIEVLGKTDSVIAHENAKWMWPNEPRWQSFLPGHFKWDYAYAIGEQKPDLIVNLVFWDQASAQPYLQGYTKYNGLYVRNGSPYVRFTTQTAIGQRLEAFRKLQDKLAKWRQAQSLLNH